MIKSAVSNLEKLSDDIVGLLSVAASQKRFNIDGKVTIKDTLVRLHQNEYFTYLRLENNLKKVETEIYNLKYYFRSSAIENKLNLDINGDDPLVTSFDSLMLNRDKMTIGAYLTGLADSISETSKRLAELGNPTLR